MLIRLPDGLSAGEAWAALAAERILIRDCSNFHGLSDRFIRICPKSSELSGRVAGRLMELVGH
jgi:threonine-phosphate decarboxylase